MSSSNFFHKNITHKRAQIFLIGFLILFLELSLIRIMGAHIVTLSFFSNLVVIASFFGIGIGCLSNSKIDFFKIFPILFFAIPLICIPNLAIETNNPDTLLFHTFKNVFKINIFYVIPFIFILTSIFFIGLGQKLGKLLNSFEKPLDAYIFELLGSILAIISFSLVSYLEIDAIFWVLVSLVIWFVITFLDLDIKSLNSNQHSFLNKFGIFFQKVNYVFFLSILILTMLLATISDNQFWSRYYKIFVKFSNSSQNQSVTIFVNKNGHQSFQNLKDLLWIYHVPYYLKNQKFKNALIIGAGGGNDVALAQFNDTQEIDAVEIDPKIAQLGKKLHPSKPYDNSNVNLIINDGRNFLDNAEKKYDLIIFALTDSLTLASSYANTRLESYLFTMESFKKAQQLLSDNAVMVFYNYYREKWLIDKISAMISLASNKPITRIIDQNNNLASIILSNDQSLYKKLTNQNFIKSNSNIKLEIFDYHKNLNDVDFKDLATDDWPFLYLKQPKIPKIYLKNLLIIIFLILLSLIFLCQKQFKIKDFSLSMFFLGFSFMLLETKNIINFQLILGSTWLVNSGVFLAILLFALLSAITCKFYSFKNKKILYFAMLVSLVIVYLLPLTKVNGYSVLTKYFIASMITFLPIFIANLIFSNFFKYQQNPRYAFGSNLLGAMMGGISEYLAMITGYHFLILIIIASYVLAFIFAELKL